MWTWNRQSVVRSTHGEEKAKMCAVHHILYMFSGLSLVIRHNNAERIRKQQVVQLTHANFPQALEKG
jgi:hypothetical protein